MRAATCSDVWMIYSSLFSKKKVALQSVNLEIGSNQVYGLLGPNGAGKTTLISLMATLLTPTRGSLEILEMDTQRDTKRIREKINITSGNPNLIWSLTAYENLKYCALSYGMNSKKDIDELIDFFELENQRDVEFDKLSTGNKQKVVLARAFVNHPQLVFLDEPTKGLDPDISRRLRKKILDLQRERGITIVLTTHYMAEAEMMCDRIAFINKGQIVAEGNQQDLKDMLKMKDRVAIKVDDRLPEIRMDGIHSMEVEDRTYTFYMDNSEERLGDLVEEVSKHATIKNIAVKEVDLEDVFTELAK
ncbi:MAG: ABC transporter ATP-binding protein [Archaeoglobaceae archaeon]